MCVNVRRFISNSKKRLANLYDRQANSLGLDQIIGRVEAGRYLSPINRPFNDFAIAGPIPPVDVLISTSAHGLLLLTGRGEIRQLLASSGGFYGLTRQEDHWLAFQKTGRHGQLISFRVNEEKLTNPELRVWGLSRGIHQIDFVDRNRLLISDTYNNAILGYRNPFDVRDSSWRSTNELHYLGGTLKHGRQSNNYKHFNSIFRHKDRIYFLAHNESAKTGRESQIYVTCPSLQIDRIVDLAGGSCHNVFVDDSRTIYCDSLSGDLVILKGGNSQRVTLGSFTRGLAITDHNIYVGGSEMQSHRDLRNTGKGYIYILDASYAIQSTVTIPGTQVNELRAITVDEHALSKY